MTGVTGATTNRDLRWVWLASEVMLVITSIAAIQILERLFDDTSFVAPMLFTVIVSHGVLIAMRWFGFGALVSGVVSFIAVILAIVATHYANTATGVILPSGRTIDQFQLDLEGAQQVFNELQTPVPPVTGFIVAGSLILWAFAYAADWAAFRLFSPGQALIPSLTVLVFVSLLGVEAGRLSSTAMLVVAGVLFVLAHRAASRAAQGIWLDTGPGRGYAALMAAGAVVGVIAALAGVLGGPSVPGANEAPLVEIGTEGRQESKPIEVISPLVQIQPRLVDQSDTVLFTVETNERAYWRIAALDVFDGFLWRSQGQFRGTDDGLDVAYPAGVSTTTVNSTFDLGELNVVWAPAAYLPVEIENLTNRASLNYEAESATFIVDTNDQSVSDGLRYRVQSQIANFTPDVLRQLAVTTDQTIDPKYLSLPSDYSPLARSEAERLTAGLDNPYDQALALQNYFRENFIYDLDVAKGHDIRRLDDFLTVQRGYCEQFAGTFASMARAIGLPSRVATGFTPGDPDPLNPNRYLVSGKHAHAWPEVWIAGAGWVAFEPTPGRGAPNATEYTGVPESQASSQPDPAQEEPVTPDQAEQAEAAAAPTPTPAASEVVPAESVDVVPEPEPVAEAELPAAPGSRMPLILLALLVAAIAWFVGIPMLKRFRDQRRQSRLGQDTRRAITLQWATVVDRFEALGMPPRPTETLEEYAHRLAFDLPIASPAFGELTELTVEASYSPDAPSAAATQRATELAAAINAAIDNDQPWLVRGAHGIDPRPLLRFNDPVVARSERLASGATTILEAPASGPIDPLQGNDLMTDG